MAGGKLGFARPEGTVITWIETRTAEVIVMFGNNNRGHEFGAMGYPTI
jgi:hypothetical protein